MKNQYSGQIMHVNERLRNFISGLVAGVISVTVCNPLDIARTRLNVLNAPSHHSDHPKYTHFTQAMRTIWKEQGWRGFYSGYRTNVIAIPIFHSIFFPLYENMKKIMQQAGYNKSESYLTATLLAGGVCNIITNPIWVVRTRLMAQYLQNKQNQYQTNNPFSVMKQMYQQEGVQSLFKGVTVSFFTITNAIIYFQLYQKLKELLGKQKKPTVSEIFISSTLSKIIASIVTYPFIVIRTVMYDQRGKSYGSILNIVKYIYKQSGMVGFYAGLKPDLIRLIPSNAITFIVYQKMKMLL